MQRLPLSCFIIAQDEGDRIARAIRSVKYWIGEVVVIDSGSTDDTISVAQSEGARVITHRAVARVLALREVSRVSLGHGMVVS